MYTFKLNIGSLTSPSKGGGYTFVGPLLEGNGLVKFKDDDNFAVVRKKVKNKLSFYGREYIALKFLYDQGETSIELKIFYNNDERFYGYLLLSGEWDEDKKTCSLDTQVIDNYSVLLKNLDASTNLIGFANNTISSSYDSVVIEVTLPCFQGSRAEAEFFYDPNGEISDNPLVAHPDWAFYEDDGETVCGIGRNNYKSKSTYLFFPYTGYTQSVLNPSQYLKKSKTSETVLKSLDRAAKLYDVLDDLLNVADTSINISEETYSEYINSISNGIYNLFIMDKSDVKRNDSENPALFELITLNELIQVYLELFDLSYKIDDGYNFSLVRRSVLTEIDYNENPQYDLTTYKDEDFTDNQKNYLIDVSKKPSKEILTFEQLDRAFFDKSVIDYDSFSEDVREINFPKFNNNVDYLIGDPDDASDEGYCLIGCTTANTIRNENSLTGASVVNGGLTAQRIFANHLDENKPYAKGVLDGFDTAFSKAKEIEIIYQNIPYYDIDIIDFDYFIKTNLGLSEPQELEISFEREFAKLKVIA